MVHRLTHAEKAGAELATALFCAAHEKQSLIPYVLQKSWFQNMETRPASLTMRDAAMPLNCTREGLERKIIFQTSTGRIQLCTVKIKLPCLDLGKSGDFT